MTPHVAAQVTAEVTAQVAAFCRDPKPAKDIMTEPVLKHWKTFQTNYLAPLTAMGVLERTIPGKPRSRMQRYKTMERDRAPEIRGDHRCGRGDFQGKCPWATADHRPSCRATWDGCRPKSVPSDMTAKLLNLAKVAADIQTLMDQAGQKNRTRFRNAVLKPLIECGLLEATIPDKARSSKQKYRLTAMGRAILVKEGLH